MDDDWLEQAWGTLLTTEAENRNKLHDGQTSRRAMSEGYDLVGLAGEVQFGRQFRQPLNLLTGSVGDPGYDFILPLRFTVDIKTARKPEHLIQEEGKVTADIYVLAGYIEEPPGARLIGWEYGLVLAKQPLRDFGAGIMTHFIHHTKLRQIEELDRRIMRLR